MRGKKCQKVLGKFGIIRWNSGQIRKKSRKIEGKIMKKSFGEKIRGNKIEKNFNL